MVSPAAGLIMANISSRLECAAAVWACAKARKSTVSKRR